MGDHRHRPRPGAAAGDRLGPDPLRVRRIRAADRPGRRAGAGRAAAAHRPPRGARAAGAGSALPPGAAGTGPDLRQVRPGAGHPHRPAAARVDRRAGQAAERGACPRLGGNPPAAGGRPGRRTGGGVPPHRNPASRGRVAGADPPRLAGRRQPGGPQGAPAWHPRGGRGRPAADDAGCGDHPVAGARPAPLPAGRGGAAVRQLAARRAGFRRRVPQRRADRGELRGRRAHRHPRHPLALDLRAAQRAGLHGRHCRRRPGRGGRRRPGPPRAGPHRRRHRAPDGAGRRLVPRGPAPGQHLLPGRRTHRGDRLRHGRPGGRAAPPAGGAAVARHGVPGSRRGGRHPAGLDRRRCRRRGGAAADRR